MARFARISLCLFLAATPLAAPPLLSAPPLAAADPADPAVPNERWQVLASPADLAWCPEKLAAARDFGESLDTAALMIIQSGIVVDQWGATDLPINCHSIRKSLLSALYGRHVADGTIDLDRTLSQLGIDDKAPSLTEQERGARLRDLLKARSGVFHPALYETKAMAAARPDRGSYPPDTYWYYNNWDFNAAGTIFENLTGQSLFESFERELALPLGMQDFDRARHTSYVTGDDSVHRAYPVRLSARDLARFGLLLLREGAWAERQVIPRDWVRESTASHSDAGPSGGYGYMWWVAENGRHFPGVSLPDGSFSARGYRGQYLVVIPDWDLVICHRVDSSRTGTRVTKTDFGKLLSLVLAARPDASNTEANVATKGDDDTAARPADDGEGAEVPDGGTVAGECEDRWTADTESTVAAMIRRFMDESAIPGLSVAVATENRIRWAQGFGSADLEHDVSVTADTLFRTASVAKPLTATVVLALADEGQIDLDAEVQRFCPEYPRKRWPLTPRQLLGHLGGVRHYKGRQEANATDHYFSLKSALSTFAEDPLVHEPGTKYLYSSFGYNLLGSVAEGASGQPFWELLRDRVLVPAAMRQTVVDDQLAVIPGRSRGYLRATPDYLKRLPDENGLVRDAIYNAPLHDTSMKVPGGGLLSTPSDLARFAIALHRGDLLNESTRDAMWTGQSTRDGHATRYGLGWRIGSLGGHHVVSHTGGQAGTSTILLGVPETGTAVALMCNLQGVSLTALAEAIAQTVLPPPPETDYTAAIDQLRQAIRGEVRQKRLPAMSVALVDDQRVVWADGFGHQDADATRPATADTVYRVGSISKLFTNIAVLQLCESGDLDLDEPVQTYLPEFRPGNDSGTPITLRQLMSHRSGLVRESPVGNYFDPSEPSLAETVASLNRTALVYPPETKTKYSNAALAVVGAVLESRLQVSHPRRVRETILGPLGMHSSSFVVTPEIEPRMAQGQMWTYDGRRFEAPGFLLGTGPAGNLYASVVDLAQFLTCIFRDGAAETGPILRPETLALMSDPITDADGKPQGFGLGFHVQSLDGHRKIGHGGAVYGFSTQLEALPERKLGVVTAASLDGTNGVMRRLADHGLRLMLAARQGRPLPPYRTTEPLDPGRARELVGRYRRGDEDRILQITALGDEVTLRRGTYHHRLRADTADGRVLIDDEFAFGTEVRLAEDGGLVIDGVTYDRLPDVPPDEIPDRWRGLVGEYGWDHNELYILEDGGKLHALIEWFFDYPLDEIDEDTFAFPDYGLYHGEKLRFVRDERGVATKVTAAEVTFHRRDGDRSAGTTFRIRPLRPIDELREQALAAQPPAEDGDFRPAELVEVTSLDPAIRLDIRYATTNNFMGEVFYRQPRAFLQRPAAEALARVQRRLRPERLGLLVHDAYRPWHVTKMFWEATPPELRDFVANPANGSRHNRGSAVDLTLCELDSGTPIEMVAGYDEFSPRAFPLYPGGTSRQRWYRDHLRRAMESEGFDVYRFEWWHFDHQDWRRYRIGNATFEELAERP